MRRPSDVPVEVPSPGRDGPGWIKVGVIAAVGFALGIAWPRLAGVQLGPNAPGEKKATASAETSAPAPAAEAPPASVAKATAKVEPAAPTKAPERPALPPSVSVRRGAVLHCETDDGGTKKGHDCGRVPGLDDIVRPRLRKVARCSAAAGQTGKLSFVVSARFDKERFSWEIGRSTTIDKLDSIRSCLETDFRGVSLESVPHEHARYTVAYAARLTEPKSGATEDDDGPAEEKKAKTTATPKSKAAGEATVAWQVALIREQPRTGRIVRRLAQGATVKIAGSKGGWYKVRFGDDFSHEGWVYRGAIGR